MAIDKNILSVDSDDDISYLALDEFLKNDTIIKKKKSITEIHELGERLIEEIELKNKKKSIKIDKLIPYIIKNSDDKYTLTELKSYSFKDVQDIYNEIKKQKQSLIVKIFHFIFNIKSEFK